MAAPVSAHPPLDEAAPRAAGAARASKARRAFAESAPAGSAVGSFVLGDIVEHDDFRLGYRARATASDADVLIEEYWPKALVQRGEDGEARLREPNFAELYEAGLQAFMAESEMLAKLEHRSLVRMGPMWPLRSTAYRLRVDTTMRRLARQLEDHPRPADEAWLRGLAEPLLGALACVHRAGRNHGNVRPGSIALRDDGSPLLLDFDAARNAIANLAPWRAVSPEPGFAAPELALYGVVPTPAADLYSLAAVLWFCSTGELPETLPTGQGAPLSRWEAVLQRRPSLRYSPGWMAALERALAFDPAVRPQDADAFRRLLATAPVSPAKPPVLEAVRVTPAMPEAARAAAVETPAPWPTTRRSAQAHAPRPEVSEPAWSPAANADHARPARPRVPEPAWTARAEPPGPAQPIHVDAAHAPPRSGPAPLDAPYVGPTPDDSEPAWQLPVFAAEDRHRVDPEPWPTSGRAPIFDGPGAGASYGAAAWARAPASPPPKRHWPWAVGGALIGGIAMLVYGLGGERVLDDLPFAQWLGKKPEATSAEAQAAAGIAAVQAAAPTAAGPLNATTPPAAGTQPASPYEIPPAGVAGSSRAAPPPAAGRGEAPRSVVPTAAKAEAPRRAPASELPRAQSADAEFVRGSDARREASVSSLDPAAACAPRSNFSLYWCMKTQCERSANYAHPQCVELRREDQR